MNWNLEPDLESSPCPITVPTIQRGDEDGQDIRRAFGNDPTSPLPEMTQTCNLANICKIKLHSHIPSEIALSRTVFAIPKPMEGEGSNWPLQGGGWWAEACAGI